MFIDLEKKALLEKAERKVSDCIKGFSQKIHGLRNSIPFGKYKKENFDFKKSETASIEHPESGNIDEKALLEKAEKIVTDNVNEFLRRVHDLSDIGPFRKYRKVTSEFQMFEPASAEFYEYRYFEKSLKVYIREELVNEIIPQLFELHGVTCLTPDLGNHIYSMFDNHSIEDVYPFEFIIETPEATIGYRYTSPVWENTEIRKMLLRYKIDQVLVIDWSDADSDSSDKVANGVSPEYRSVVKYVSAKEFFLSYFSKEEYDLFVTNIKTAVAEANKDIGFTTIPSLSLSYLNKFKTRVEKTLSELCFKALVFEETGRNTPIRNLLSPQDYSELDEHFVKQGLYKALVGSEKFAVSFITSEYMYQILKAGGQFDYTAVVCGYIKSIEQLLYKMLKITLINLDGRQLMIKPADPNDTFVKTIRVKNPKNRKSWLIPFQLEYEQYFDITLGPMIWFVNDNETGWYLSQNGKNTVRRYLFNFSKEDRNEHFHKDNIESFDEVRRIRNNTLALMYYLIGGYRLTSDLTTDRELLGIYDDTFDRMYLALAEVPKGRLFYLQFHGKEEIAAYCPYQQERPKYDTNGSLKESSICFVKRRPNVDYVELMTNRTKEDEIIVDRNHMPEHIWLSLGKGKRKPIEW